jgi:RNA polymerase sigma-70 factor (ECF subfamily)
VTSIDTEDFELLDGWRAGDREAGNTLFERHFDAVCRFFANKVNDNVDDLIQKTFLGCIEGRDRFRKQSSFRTYLFAVAHNVLRVHFRSRPSDDTPVDFAVTTVDELTPSPSAVFASHEEQRLLLEGLRHIPIESQMVLELYYWEDMAASELAEVMAIPEGTVRSRIRRAKVLLARRMQLLARSPALLKTTMNDLDHWVRSLRERLSTEAVTSETA